MRLVRTKPAEQLLAGDGPLRRTMSLWQLTLFSVGATLGTGIFVILGQAVPEAGPSVVLAFLPAAVTVVYVRDGLIPPVFRRVRPRRRVPVASTLIVALFISVPAGLVPLGSLAEATSIGTLFAFAIVNTGVLVLRYREPGLPRSFRTPFFPVTPVLGTILCGVVMAGLGGATWLAFGLWMLAGLACYLLYGYRHYQLNTAGRTSLG